MATEEVVVDRLKIFVPSEDNWCEVRDLRMRALADSPKAFLSTYQQEEVWSEQDWRRSVRNSTWLIARYAGEAVGIVRISTLPEAPQEHYLEAMWVASAYRGKSIGRLLVEEAVDSASRGGGTAVRLAVLDRNPGAMGFFRVLGFAPLSRRTADIETQMMRFASSNFEERVDCAAAPYA